MSESRLKKNVLDTLTAQILKTIKMVMVIGVLSLTPDLSQGQGLRKGIHSMETVLTVLLCGQNLTHLKTTIPRLTSVGLVDRGEFNGAVLMPPSKPELKNG